MNFYITYLENADRLGDVIFKGSFESKDNAIESLIPTALDIIKVIDGQRQVEIAEKVLKQKLSVCDFPNAKDLDTGLYIFKKDDLIEIHEKYRINSQTITYPEFAKICDIKDYKENDTFKIITDESQDKDTICNGKSKDYPLGYYLLVNNEYIDIYKKKYNGGFWNVNTMEKISTIKKTVDQQLHKITKTDNKDPAIYIEGLYVFEKDNKLSIYERRNNVRSKDETYGHKLRYVLSFNEILIDIPTINGIQKRKVAKKPSSTTKQNYTFLNELANRLNCVPLSDKNIKPSTICNKIKKGTPRVSTVSKDFVKKSFLIKNDKKLKELVTDEYLSKINIEEIEKVKLKKVKDKASKVKVEEIEKVKPIEKNQ